MSTNMINWPVNAGWFDTGEGGLFAYAVVVAPNGQINIDFDALASSNYRRGRDELDAAVFLGSTRSSFYDEQNGEYFLVTRDDLTPEGQKVVDILSQLGEVRIVTGLDT